MLAGPDHRRLLRLSMMAGAVFVMGMDLLARTLSPAGEIRLGVLSASIGGPFFPVPDRQESRARGDLLMRLEAESIIVELGEREVLKGVSASFQPGALTGIIGANGAGKTTLLRALAGLVPVKSGRISLEGAPIDSFDRKETARRVGYLAQKQEPAFPFRADETVMMGQISPPGQARARDRGRPRGGGRGAP